MNLSNVSYPTRARYECIIPHRFSIELMCGDPTGRQIGTIPGCFCSHLPTALEAWHVAPPVRTTALGDFLRRASGNLMNAGEFDRPRCVRNMPRPFGWHVPALEQVQYPELYVCFVVFLSELEVPRRAFRSLHEFLFFYLIYKSI